MEENKKPLNMKVIYAGIFLILLMITGGLMYYFLFVKGRVYTDQASISAPQINLTSPVSGVLQSMMVKPGDSVAANTPVAQVGNQLVTTQTAGLIVSTNDNIGQTFNPGQTVVSMIDPSQLRLVAQVDENKGLANVKVGQRAIFTVDAFGSKRYVGTVDEISPTANNSAVVFNISNTRETKQFDVKIRFDVNSYPELRNGMSAKVTIFTD